ncbi:MAG: hypothetical protein ACYC91_09830 [Solirubrobacteraceae bacterium]
MSYRRRSSPLQSTRTAVAMGYCASLGAAALAISNPVGSGNRPGGAR